MKTPIHISLFLFVVCQCCFAQTDSNLIGAGDWSAVVRDSQGGPFLRGRLLVYDDQGISTHNHARIYLELQHVCAEKIWYPPIEIYCFGTNLDLQFEDAHGQPIPSYPSVIVALSCGPCWVTLPMDATVRVRVDDGPLGPHTKPDGFDIQNRMGDWIIPPNSTNDYFLAASFTPSTNNPSPLHYATWHGTLKLPKVKIHGPGLLRSLAATNELHLRDEQNGDHSSPH
jgi:hypothetical protein